MTKEDGQPTKRSDDSSLSVSRNSLEDHTDKIFTFIVAGYDSAREELIESIKARDVAVSVYLTGMSILFGAYAAANLKDSPSEFGIEILFLIAGVLGLAMSQIVASHQIKIATIGYFIDRELIEHLKSLKSDIAPIDWESSETNKTTSRLPRRLEYLYYYILFLSPQIAAVLVSLNANFGIWKDNAHPKRHWAFMVAYLVCICATFAILHISNSLRQKYNSHRKHI